MNNQLLNYKNYFMRIYLNSLKNNKINPDILYLETSPYRVNYKKSYYYFFNQRCLGIKQYVQT